MKNINDHPLSVPRDSGVDIYSLLVRVEMSSSLNSYPLATNQSIIVVIHVFVNFESVRFSIGSLDKEASFDAFLSNDEREGNKVLNYALASSEVAKVLSFPALLTP